MHARDILSRPVVTVQPQTSLRSAVALLTSHGFAAMPVVDDDDRVVGLLSESSALAAASRMETASVEAVMSTPVEVVAPGTDTSTIASRMLLGGLRSMPVVESGVLVGIVARRDLLRALIRDDSTVEAKVRALLDDYAGSRRQWEIDVADGKVAVRGDFTDDGEQHIVASLARTVEGVHEVETVDTGAVRRR